MTIMLGDAATARIATSRFSPALVAAAAVAAIAIVAHPAWWTFVFVAFAIALAVLDRRNARPSDVLRLSLALGGSAALGMTGLVLISVSEFISAFACPYDPTSCQGLGPPALYAGIAIAIVGTMGFAATAWYLAELADRSFKPSSNSQGAGAVMCWPTLVGWKDGGLRNNGFPSIS